MQIPVIAVIHETPKRRSLFEDFAFVYIEHESFQFLLSYVKHGGGSEILRISDLMLAYHSRLLGLFLVFFIPVPCIL